MPLLAVDVIITAGHTNVQPHLQNVNTFSNEHPLPKNSPSLDRPVYYILRQLLYGSFLSIILGLFGLWVSAFVHTVGDTIDSPSLHVLLFPDDFFAIFFLKLQVHPNADYVLLDVFLLVEGMAFPFVIRDHPAQDRICLFFVDHLQGVVFDESVGNGFGNAFPYPVFLGLIVEKRHRYGLYSGDA
jgi:hypothetical protein